MVCSQLFLRLMSNANSSSKLARSPFQLQADECYHIMLIRSSNLGNRSANKAFSGLVFVQEFVKIFHSPGTVNPPTKGQYGRKWPKMAENGRNGRKWQKMAEKDPKNGPGACSFAL